jgi:hypothetical protein
MTVTSHESVPTSRTIVPEGLDAVGQARAELKAVLAAIEEKGNVPRRVGRAVDSWTEKGKRLARERPAAALGLVITGAVAVGLIVWGGVRLYTR